MGLRQKSRRIRLGVWENIALLMALLTLLSAAGWWYARNTGHWERTTARVTGLYLVENNHPLSASRPRIHIKFEFMAAGRTFSGIAPLDTWTRLLYRPVPQEVLDLLKNKGYLSFADLPPEVQDMLRRKGIDRLDSVPAPLLDTLRAQGFSSVRDFPDDMRRMAREGDYAALEREADRILSGARRNPNPQKGARDATPVADGGLLHIRYNPADPDQCKIDRMPWLPDLTGPVPLFALAIGTLAYCALFYPWAKDR